MINNSAIVIAGPTASGKTSLAVEVAKVLHGEILSADSRQIYRGMDLGTGKDLEEYGAIPHHLIDVADPSEMYTLYHYQRDCYSALNSCFSREVPPIICGGTGLYIEAVLKKYKLANVPEDEDFRKRKTSEDKELLAEELSKLAPDIYKETDTSSKKRIIRSLEIATYRFNNPIVYSSDNAPQINPTILITDWDVDELKERITNRMFARFELGMVEEVATLKDAGISNERLDLFGMEYRAINKYLNKEYTYDEMCNNLQQEIFRLAKRQRTWFRGMSRRGFIVHTVPDASLNVALSILKDVGYPV